MKMYEVKCNQIPRKVEGRNLVDLLEQLEEHYLYTVYQYGNKMSGENLNIFLKGTKIPVKEKLKQYIAYSDEVKGYIDTTVLMPMNAISNIVINKPLKPLLDELRTVVQLGEPTRTELK